MKPDHLNSFKEKALEWANDFDVCCYLDSNNYDDPYGKYDYLIAAGRQFELSTEAGDRAFESLKDFYDQHHEWMFGFLTYDLKNEIEDLSSNNPDQLGFPYLYFFVPEHLIICRSGNAPEVLIGNIDVLIDIENRVSNKELPDPEINVKSRLSKKSYVDAVIKIRERIARGDIYEANLCQEFYAEHAEIDPLRVYLDLKQLSPTPFSSFFKLNDKYVMCASPERFLKKEGRKMISQPIKGTARRSIDPAEDRQIMLSFRDNLKEQTENVMIVDLVRNDLTKSAVKGSVKVEELFGVYAFPQVYQMISTITCELDEETHFVDAIRQAFPMGSMTGAPKYSAMQIIEEVESSRRGIYSGALGYIEPNGDFDFNVVIRSILYDQNLKYLSFQVGGAITYCSDANHEYEECQLKASAIMQTLKQ